jgi:hypothetical protein
MRHSTKAGKTANAGTAAKGWMSWSSGKDSTFALHAARQDDAVEVVGLLVTFNGEADRVAMHAVRRVLVEAQADRLGLPLHAVELPSPCSNVVYEQQMAAAVATALDLGVDHFVFGDLFLADVRAYREEMLEHTGVAPVFPLWGQPTDVLARQMLAAGVRAVLPASTPGNCPASSPVVPSTSSCSSTCPTVSTRAANAASSTRSCGTALGSPPQSTSNSARSLSVTDSCSATSRHDPAVRL